MKTMQNQRGFAAIAAIFLIVVLAALGGYMATFSSSQQITAGQDAQGIRAYWAARSGLEWGLASVSSAAACPAATTTLSLDGFSVVVSCTLTGTYIEAASSSKIFQLTSVAQLGSAPGGSGFIERSITAYMEK